MTQMAAREKSEQSTDGRSAHDGAAVIKNVFDVRRADLLTHLWDMRSHLLGKTLEAGDSRHHQEIGAMGNYHVALSKRRATALRSVDEEDDGKSRPIFGNPYKQDKSGQHNTDDIDDGGRRGLGPRGRRRRGGRR